jgi:hypothetical protein
MEIFVKGSRYFLLATSVCGIMMVPLLSTAPAQVTTSTGQICWYATFAWNMLPGVTYYVNPYDTGYAPASSPFSQSGLAAGIHTFSSYGTEGGVTGPVSTASFTCYANPARVMSHEVTQLYQIPNLWKRRPRHLSMLLRAPAPGGV